LTDTYDEADADPGYDTVLCPSCGYRVHITLPEPPEPSASVRERVEAAARAVYSRMFSATPRKTTEVQVGMIAETIAPFMHPAADVERLRAVCEGLLPMAKAAAFYLEAVDGDDRTGEQRVAAAESALAETGGGE